MSLNSRSNNLIFNFFDYATDCSHKNIKKSSLAYCVIWYKFANLKAFSFTKFWKIGQSSDPTMKFIFFAIIALLTGAKCEPQHEPDTGKAPEVVGNTTMDDINAILKMIKGEARLRALTYMVDKQCIVDKYSELNLLAYIPSEKNEKKKIHPKKINSARNLALNMFIAVVARCNKKFDAVVDYVFENSMTTHILYNAMKDEPDFKMTSDVITCVNFYAEQKNITDVHMYNLKYKMDEKTQQQCDELIEDSKHIKKDATDHFGNSEGEYEVGCVYKLVDSLEKFLLEHALLMQVELPADQKQEKRISFKKNFSTIADSAILCAGKILPEVLKHTKNAEKLGKTHKHRFSFLGYKGRTREQPAPPPLQAPPHPNAL